MRSLNRIHIILLISIIAACKPIRLQKAGIYAEVTAEEFLRLSKMKDVQIIDVRTQSEFNKSHIAKAINASYISGNFSEIVASNHLNTSKTVLIYCETQHRSLFAARKLHKMGFQKIIDLDKGMMHYRKEGNPYVKADSLNQTN